MSFIPSQRLTLLILLTSKDLRSVAPNLTSKLTKYTILEVKNLFFGPKPKYNFYFVKDIHSRDYFGRWFANLSQNGECSRQFLVKSRGFFFLIFSRKVL